MLTTIFYTTTINVDVFCRLENSCILVICLSFFLFRSFCYRYEVESDENRLLIAYEICRRFLGIQSDVKINNDDKTANETVTDSNEKTELNHKDEIDKTDEFNGDDLVVDILNDELITQVRDKIEGKQESRLAGFSLETSDYASLSVPSLSSLDTC